MHSCTHTKVCLLLLALHTHSENEKQCFTKEVTLANIRLRCRPVMVARICVTALRRQKQEDYSSRPAVYV